MATFHVQSQIAEDDQNARLCTQIGMRFWAQYNTTRNEDLLNRTSDLHRLALRLRLPGHPERPESCLYLAMSLFTRFQGTGDVRLLAEAIQLWSEALRAFPPGHSHRPVTCSNLATSLAEMYKYTGDDRSLTMAVGLGREGLRLRPHEDKDRPNACAILANLLHTLYNHTGNEDALIETIALHREALRSHVPGHPNRDKICANLSMALCSRFNGSGNKADIDEAIDLGREALKLRRRGHPDRGHACLMLGNVLYLHYVCNSDGNILAEAIILLREAVELYPKGHAERHYSCAQLSISLSKQYSRTGDADLLIEAIDIGREGLRLCPQGHKDRRLSCSNIAGLLCNLYDHTMDEKLMDEAIELMREALKSCPTKPSDRVTSCATLGRALLQRYHRTKDPNIIMEVIDLFREAHQLCPQGHPYRHSCSINLSGALLTQYERTGCKDEKLLTQTISLGIESLKLCPHGHADRYHACTDLALSFREYFRVHNDTNALLGAIELHRESLELCPLGHPGRENACSHLASSLHTYCSHTKDLDGLDEVIALYRECITLSSEHEKWSAQLNLSGVLLTPNSPHYDVSLGTLYLVQALQNETDDPLEAVPAILDILNMCWTQFLGSDLDASRDFGFIYQQLIRLLPLLVNPVFDLRFQLWRLRQVRQLGSDAFVNAILHGGDWGAGLEHLEVTQGLLWAQRLQQRDPQTERVPETQMAELESCLKVLAAQSTGPSTTSLTLHQPSRDELHKHSSRMYAAIRKIRKSPGLERFMLGETRETLLTVTREHPAVVLVGARGYFYALIVAAGRVCGDGPLKLYLTAEDLEMTSVFDKQNSHRGAAEPRGLESDSDERGIRPPPPKVTPLDRYLRLLWLKIVKPVLDVLQQQSLPVTQRPRLHWCPTGLFAPLPLHAAGIYDGPKSQRVCCADYVVSSYTPTLTNLLRVQQAVTPLNRKDLALVLLAEHRAQETLPTIPGVVFEVDEIKSVATSNKVSIVDHIAGSTTISRTSEAIQKANIAHIACHGVQDPSDATRSGFCLGDGRLAISDLSKLNIKHGFLAFLSACETARGSDEQPDQAMHLAAAMLFTGFKSVIATMWAISDEDGPKVSKWFYEELFTKEVIDADAVAYALDSAVGKLRMSGVPSKQWAPFIHMGA